MFEESTEFGASLPETAPVPVLDQESFLERLRLERDRSDRLGYDLVVLGYSAAGRGEPSLAGVVDGLTRRVRSTDSVGWLRKDQLGVLLLRVTLEDAQRLAVELLRGLTSAPLRCVLFQHPPPSWKDGISLLPPDETDRAGPAATPGDGRRATPSPAPVNGESRSQPPAGHPLSSETSPDRVRG